jgi:hypothetical protein
VRLNRLAARLAATASAACLAALLTGCGGSDGDSNIVRNDLSLRMESMGPHVGHDLEVRVIHVETGREIGYVSVTPITNTDFTVVLPEVLVAGERYWVDFYADYNMNGRYDDPPVDHAWRRVVNATGANAVVTFVHDTAFTDIDFPSRL